MWYFFAICYSISSFTKVYALSNANTFIFLKQLSLNRFFVVAFLRPRLRFYNFFKYTFFGKIQFLPFPATDRTAATAKTCSLNSELQGAPTRAGTPGPLETPEGMLARAGTPAIAETATRAGTLRKSRRHQ
jgi:hypothetical protein